MSRRHQLDPAHPQSLAQRLDEVLSAQVGAELLPEACRLALCARHAAEAGQPLVAAELPALLAAVQVRWPAAVAGPFCSPPEALGRAVAVLQAAPTWDGALLDALFEQLVARQARGRMGQFFTPRVIVEALVQIVAPRDGEQLLDPACGSGAFLQHAARLAPRARLWGVDLDPRAILVARALLGSGVAGPWRLEVGDGLSSDGPLGTPAGADVVLSNPPFAGDVAGVYRGQYKFGDAALVERDTLFVEQAIRQLRPGGRMALVLPHNKVGGQRFTALRAFLLERCCLVGVISLPREAFLPHTAQKTAVILAVRRASPRTPHPAERVHFFLSTRSGKDSRGDPVRDPAGFGGLDCDLDEAIPTLRAAMAEAPWDA